MTTDTGRWTKDPTAVLDWSWHWEDWLAPDETIDTFTVAVPTGLTLAVPATEANGVVTAWLSGGSNNRTYLVPCQITTSAGRTDKRTIVIDVAYR